MIMFLLSKFKQKKWGKISPAKRQTVLQKVENKMARRAGRPSLPVSIHTDPDWYCYGMFEVCNGKQILHINISLISDISLRFQALATILHEGRHATQTFITENDIAWFQFKAKRWKRNMANYVSSKQDKNLYAMQEIERDAQLFTLKKLKRWYRKFAKEDDFLYTYDAIKHQFDENERKAKERYGRFYRYKINREIDHMKY